MAFLLHILKHEYDQLSFLIHIILLDWTILLCLINSHGSILVSTSNRTLRKGAAE